MRKKSFLFSSLILIFSLFVFLSSQNSPQPQLSPLNPAFVNYDWQTDENYGYIPHPIDPFYFQNRISEEDSRLEALPTTYDLRAYGLVTSVKNQGNCGSCWTFGNLASFEGRILFNLFKRKGIYRYKDYSEQNMKECKSCCLWHGCAGGNAYIASNYLSYLAARKDADDPYVAAPCTCDPSPPKRRVAKNWFMVCNGCADTTAEIVAIKKAIYTKGVVVTALYMVGLSDPHFEGNILVWPSCPYSINHQVAIVGWDDNMPYSGGSGCWIVKNSWGNSWGDSGYFYVAYGSASLGYETSYYGYSGYKSNQKLYLWDEAGWLVSWGYGDNHAQAASVFVTQVPKETVTHVEFWSVDFDVDYTIRVYKKVTGSGSGTTFSKLKATLSGRCSYPGYNRKRLPEPFTFNKAGKRFGVIIEFTCNSGYSYPVPSEYDGWPSDFNPPIQTDCSFIRHNEGDGWYDLEGVGANAGIRLRTEYPLVPELISPADGAVLDNGRYDKQDDIVWDFDWSDIGGATKYNLYVKGEEAFIPLINREIDTSSYHYLCSGCYITEGNRFNWKWKVRAYVDGKWRKWSETRRFDVEPPNTDPPK